MAMRAVLDEKIYESQPEEHAFELKDVEGTLPKELRGTFLRSGPGLFEAGKDTLNFFDGHALIAGVSFDGGRAVFRSRYVKTPLYLAETAKKAMQKRRVFTNLPSRWSNLFDLAFGNNAMHDVYAWGGKVIAGNDPGHFALDAKTLETLGPETWGGAVPKGHEMSPMPYRDPATDRLIGWIKKPGVGSPDRMKFVELDHGFEVVAETPMHKLAAGPVLVHDHRASAKWYVAMEQSIRLSAGSALWGAKTAFQAFTTPPGGTSAVLLFARGAGGAGGRFVRVPIDAPSIFAFHVVNAFDRGDRVVVDTIVYDGRVNFDTAGSKAHLARTGHTRVDGPRPVPTRLVIDPEKGAIVERKVLGKIRGEAPEVPDAKMGAEYKYAYFPTTTDDSDLVDRSAYFHFDGVGKLDVDTGTARSWVSKGVVSPPAFVPRPGGTEEDDGWLLAWLLEERGASVLVFDARDLAAGPVATLRLGVHLPGVSHTRWAADVQLDA